MFSETLFNFLFTGLMSFGNPRSKLTAEIVNSYLPTASPDVTLRKPVESMFVFSLSVKWAAGREKGRKDVRKFGCASFVRI